MHERPNAGVIDARSPVEVDLCTTMIKQGDFDGVYRQAAGDAQKIPWADAQPNPMMVKWFNAIAPQLVRTGARVAVVGSGLGDDVAEMAARGYDVTGFDVSPAAVDWSKQRFPSIRSCFMVADLLDLPARLVHRFDLVVEIYTIQSVRPELRERVASAIVSLACPRRGLILAIARARPADTPLDESAGPPWTLTRDELEHVMNAGGAKPVRPTDEFEDDESPPKLRLRGTFGHAG